MSNYHFTVVDVVAERYAAAPQLTAQLQIMETTGQTIHAIALRCQVRIAPQRRNYTDDDAAGLRSLFGERQRWSQTLKPFVWMHCNTMVQGFTGITETSLALPCSYDFDVTGSQYLHSLGEGSIPLAFLFSGTVFTRGSRGFGVEQVPWDCDAAYLLPVSVWRQVIDLHYPNTGWIRMDKDSISELADYKAQHGLMTWEDTVKSLLHSNGRVVG